MRFSQNQPGLLQNLCMLASTPIWTILLLLAFAESGYPVSVKVGDRMPSCSITDIAGHRISVPPSGGRVLLLEMTGPDDLGYTAERFKYSDLLAKSYGSAALLAVCAIYHQDNLAERVKDLDLPAPLEKANLVTESEHLRLTLGLSKGQSLTLIADSQGIVRFLTDRTLLGDDSKRQLVERFLLGTPQYKLDELPTVLDLFQPGAKPPELVLRDLETDKALPLAAVVGAHKLWILFPSVCSVCDANNYSAMFRPLIEKVHQRKKGIALVFVTPGQAADLRRILNEPLSSSGLYVIETPEGVNPGYVTRSLSSQSPQALAFSSDAKVAKSCSVSKGGDIPVVCFDGLVLEAFGEQRQ